MARYSYKNIIPKIDDSAFIADSVDIIGDVTIESNANVWYNCVLRGDMASISIGENTNVQDCTMIHVDTGVPTIVGKNVTIGHKVTLHGCNIGDGSLIGMDSIILDNVEIGENSLVAAGSLVSPGKKFPPRSFIMGRPAKLVRELTKDEAEKYGNHYNTYLKIASSYKNGDIKRID